MSSPAARLPPIARAWPVQLALGVVVALVALMVGADLVIARRVARETTKIVEDTQRSIELLEDLHATAFRLVHVERDPSSLSEVRGQLAQATLEYDKIADNLGERAEWHQLRAVLEELLRAAAAGEYARLRLGNEEVDQRVDRLIRINREATRANAEEIRAAHRSAILADASIGAVVLLLCVAVALVLRRVLARQRELSAAHILLLGERNRELDLFAGRAAHDLRAPLSPIRGYADLLSSGAESPAEVQHMASRIRAAVDKMARVVDDMLELSRASPPAAAQEILDELAADLHGVEVTSDLPNEEVACAPGVLQQILRNLIQNAVKFRSRERRLSIRISGHRLPETLMLELRVEDNGVGMDAELATHAFEPYYRGRTDREVPGHGLGLAIVDRMTRALGGRLEVRSAPDQGCTALVTLPLAPR